MSPNSGYSESELMQMQQDAIRRVREMQARAQQTLEQTWSSSQAPPEPEPEPDFDPPEPVQAPALPAPVQSQGQTGQGGQQQGNPFAGTPLAGLGNLGGLFQGRTSSPVSGLIQWAGGERGILLGLLALLMGEGADPTLLLALFYLVMFDDGESSSPGT